MIARLGVIFPFANTLEHLLNSQVFWSVFALIELVHAGTRQMLAATPCVEVSSVGAGHCAWFVLKVATISAVAFPGIPELVTDPSGPVSSRSCNAHSR